MKQKEIVFCGNSLFLSGLAASLYPIKEFRVRIVDSVLDKAMPELKMLRPDVVIFEAAHNTRNMIDVLHRADSRMLIVVVFPETDLIEVFWDGTSFTSSIDDLVRAIMETL